MQANKIHHIWQLSAKTSNVELFPSDFDIYMACSLDSNANVLCVQVTLKSNIDEITQ